MLLCLDTYLLVSESGFVNHSKLQFHSSPLNLGMPSTPDIVGLQLLMLWEEYFSSSFVCILYVRCNASRPQRKIPLDLLEALLLADGCQLFQPGRDTSPVVLVGAIGA